MPVGRLDYSTEGLLLLTNDGEFKRQLELPSTGVPRTYRARAFGNVSQAQLEDLAVGITIDGMQYGPIEADLVIHPSIHPSTLARPHTSTK